MGIPEPTVRINKKIRVLSASIDSGLNRTRAMVLREHGFEVTTSESVAHAIKEIEANGFDVLIFGSTLPRDTCWKLAGTFRQHHSAGKIVEILPSPCAPPKNAPDATVIGSEEPARLVTAITELA